MAISINFGTKVITVPKADMELIQESPEIRQLNLNTFRLVLKDLEDDEEGIAFPKTHNHNPPVTVGGVTLARVIEILEPYTITFENGQYAVNLVGANSNVSDKTNVNQVSVRSSNSAGLTDTVSSSDIATAVLDELVSNHQQTGSLGQMTNDISTQIQSLWNKPLSEITYPNTIGQYIKQKVMTTSKFLALK